NKNKDAIQYYQNNDFEIVRSYQPEMYGEQMDLALMKRSI
ncbi:MAG: GNAT family N-acetyltransferase, partial [Staphylococcus sp.]|nr:GNAT family N-acetyltransferase [Staphylococcus sp.]